MTFSLSLVPALLLVFPGLNFQLGLRTGERTDLFTPTPDDPGSITTLFIVALGAIGAHVAGAGFFATQAQLCAKLVPCFAVGFGPNPYRALLAGPAAFRQAPDFAFEAWLAYPLVLGSIMGLVGFRMAKIDAVSGRLDDYNFGWLASAVRQVKRGDSFIIAYVLTKANHNGASIGFEGVIQQLTLDSDQSIKTIILRGADRFLVRIDDAGIERKDIDAAPIPLIHITAAEIVNFAFEVVQVPTENVEAIDAEPISR